MAHQEGKEGYPVILNYVGEVFLPAEQKLTTKMPREERAQTHLTRYRLRELYRAGDRVHGGIVHGVTDITGRSQIGRRRF